MLLLPASWQQLQALTVVSLVARAMALPALGALGLVVVLAAVLALSSPHAEGILGDLTRLVIINDLA